MSRSMVALGLLAAVLGFAVLGLAERKNRLLDRVDELETKLARKERPVRPPPSPLLAAPEPALAPETPPAASSPAETAVAKPTRLSSGDPYSTHSNSIELGPEVENGRLDLSVEYPGYIQLPNIGPHYTSPPLESHLDLTPAQWQYIEGLQKARDEEIRQSRERYELLLKQGLDSRQLTKYDEMKHPEDRIVFKMTTARYALRSITLRDEITTAGVPAPQ